MAKLLVVGDYPTYEAYENNEPFTGKKDEIFWQVALEVCGIPKEDIVTAYAYPQPADEAPTDKSVAMYRPDLVETIRHTKPDAILLLGKTAFTCLMGTTPLPLSKLVHKTYSVKIGPKDAKKVIPVLTTWTSFFAGNNKTHLLEYATALDNAYRHACDPENRKDSITKVVSCTTLDEFDKALDYCVGAGQCCFDFETTEITSLKTRDPEFRVTMLSVSFQIGSSYTIPLWHKSNPFTDAECMEILATFHKKTIANPAVRKIAHNVKYDYAVLFRYGFTAIRGVTDDTMLQHSLIDENAGHGLKEIAPQYYPQVMGWETRIKSMGYSNAPMNMLSVYAGMDTDLTLRIDTIQQSILLQDPRLYAIYRNQTMPACITTLRMEHTGIPYSRERAAEYIKRCEEMEKDLDTQLRNNKVVRRFEAAKSAAEKVNKIQELEGKIAKSKMKHHIARWEAQIADIKSGVIVPYKGINFGSPAQLSVLLYSKEGFNTPLFFDRRKRQEVASTDAKALKMVKDDTGFIDTLRVLRTVQKNKATSLVGFSALVDSNDRIHPSLLQHVTVTGRLASRDPNSQNVPKHIKIKHPYVEEVVGMVKKCFIVPEGYAMWQADYSQIELRIIAELAEEDTMIDAYNKGLDLHKLTACKIIGIDIADWGKLDPKEASAARSKAKASNFGLIFLQTVEGFREYAKDNYGVNLTEQEAQDIYDAFFEQYPKIRYYHSLYIKKGQKFGYVRTMFGRKRRLPDIHSNDDGTRKQDERYAVNSPVQGSNGELSIFALPVLENRLPRSASIINQIHDAIVGLCRIEDLPYVARVVKSTMENLPTEMYFGAKFKHVKPVADLEYSTTDWNTMNEYKL